MISWREAALQTGWFVPVEIQIHLRERGRRGKQQQQSFHSEEGFCESPGKCLAFK